MPALFLFSALCTVFFFALLLVCVLAGLDETVATLIGFLQCFVTLWRLHNIIHGVAQSGISTYILVAHSRALFYMLLIFPLFFAFSLDAVFVISLANLQQESFAVEADFFISGWQEALIPALVRELGGNMTYLFMAKTFVESGSSMAFVGCKQFGLYVQGDTLMTNDEMFTDYDQLMSHPTNFGYRFCSGLAHGLESGFNSTTAYIDKCTSSVETPADRLKIEQLRLEIEQLKVDATSYEARLRYGHIESEADEWRLLAREFFGLKSAHPVLPAKHHPELSYKASGSSQPDAPSLSGKVGAPSSGSSRLPPACFSSWGLSSELPSTKQSLPIFPLKGLKGLKGINEK